MSLNFDNAVIKNNINKAEFGLEKESLRVDENGFMSHTPHPFDGDKNIDRDFCENQVEIITEVCQTTQELCENLEALQKKVICEIAKKGEFLWCFSNPPRIKGEDDIPVAEFHGAMKSKTNYRHYLEEKYGKRKMLFSGIHYNFSFSKKTIEAAFDKAEYNSIGELKNDIYLDLARKLTKYSWLIVYLTAASPVMDGSYFKDSAIGKSVITDYASVRCGEIGYWNDFVPTLDYSSVDSYINSVNAYIKSGRLRSASELYYPIRLKPRGKNSLEALQENGVNHIELRMLDLNPLSPIGVKKEDIDFIYLLILYLSSLESIEFPESDQLDAIKNMKKAALLNDDEIILSFDGEKRFIKDAAKKVLNEMDAFFEKHPTKNSAEVLSLQRAKIEDGGKRYAIIIKESFGSSFAENGLRLAKSYTENYTAG